MLGSLALSTSSPGPDTAAVAPAKDIAGVIAPPPLIYISGLALGFGLAALLPAASLPDAVRWPVGGALALAGLALARSFFTTLQRAHTPVDPYRATTTLVTSGPYRFSRNPGYLGMALGYAGIAVLSGTPWPFASLVPTLILIDAA